MEGWRALGPDCVAVCGRVLNQKRSDVSIANTFVRREVLAAIGGLDERFASGAREASDLCYTLRERHGRVAHSERAVVAYPSSPPEPRRADLGAAALLYGKHPVLYRRQVLRQPLLQRVIVMMLGAFARHMKVPSR